MDEKICVFERTMFQSPDESCQYNDSKTSEDNYWNLFLSLLINIIFIKSHRTQLHLILAFEIKPHIITPHLSIYPWFMQIRANQRISLLNLNAGNITYFLHRVLFQPQNPHGTLHWVSLFLSSLFTVFKSNGDQIPAAPLTLLFSITKFHATNESLWPTNCCLSFLPCIIYLIVYFLQTQT